MIENLQIYISKSFNPYKNIATEKHLMDTLPEKTFIMYLWQNENTVVIGRNQNAWNECRCALLEEDGGFVARRFSGGGAVFHDKGNLNFTFICHAEDYNVLKQLQVIQTALSCAGISTEISGRNDILVSGKKFSGNAFFNSQGKSCHHGTILISADTEKLTRYLTPPKAKLQAKGVKSVKARVINLSEISPDLNCETVKENMCRAFEKVYGMKADNIPIPENSEINALTQKLGSREHIYGSTLPFTVSMEDYFPWGHIMLNADIKNGIISEAKVYTDAMDWQIPEITEAALVGCKFNSEAMTKVLKKALPQDLCKDISGMIESQLN